MYLLFTSKQRQTQTIHPSISSSSVSIKNNLRFGGPLTSFVLTSCWFFVRISTLREKRVWKANTADQTAGFYKSQRVKWSKDAICSDRNLPGLLNTMGQQSHKAAPTGCEYTHKHCSSGGFINTFCYMWSRATCSGSVGVMCGMLKHFPPHVRWFMWAHCMVISTKSLRIDDWTEAVKVPSRFNTLLPPLAHWIGCNCYIITQSS